MLKKLVPDGRTHRLSVLVASMLAYASNVAWCSRDPDDEEDPANPLLADSEGLEDEEALRLTGLNRVAPLRGDDSMTSIRDALSEFLSETGEGNRRSMSSAFMVIDLFRKCIDEYGHEDLNEFERQRFDKEWSEDNRFCDIFSPDHIQPFHVNSFLSTFVVRKVMGTKGFRKACGPVMKKLTTWLLEKRYWDEDAMRYYRELVGDDPGGDLLGCDELTTALLEYVEAHPVEEEVADVDDDDYYNDQLTIKKVEPGMIVFDAFLDGEEDVRISLPKSVTSKAKAGWSVTMEVARIKGKWRILGVGNVYP